MTINFYIISWSLFILNARFRIPSTPYISSPYVSFQRKLIDVDFFRCNASFNQPKIPGWKDHIVINPQSFCIWSRRRPSSLGSKASSFVPFTQHVRMYKRDVFRGSARCTIDRPQIVFFLAWRAVFHLCRTFPRNPARSTKMTKRRKLSKARSIYRFIYSRPWR